MKKYLLTFLLASCAATPSAPTTVEDQPAPISAPSSPAQPDLPKPAGLESTCPSPGVYHAVDLSQPVTRKFLDAARYLGIRTIIRYYEYPVETIRGKLPKLEEIALINMYGFNLLGVFQHNNNVIRTFTSARGKADAERSVELSRLWNVPVGAAIYFGVDFDASPAEQSDVKAYFQQASPIVRAAGFKVGVYGSGLTLKSLLAAGLVDYTWISMSTGFNGTREFTASGKWNLKQSKDVNCGGINVDFNMKGEADDYGQWSIK